MKQLKLRNVFGRPTKVNLGDDNKDVNGVTKVATLPETGEEGKIYYNTTTKIYYVSDGSTYTPIGVEGMPVIDAEYTEEESQGVSFHRYTLDPNNFYEFTETYTSSEISNIRIDLSANTDDGRTKSYIWRLKYSTGMNIIIGNAVIPDATKEILDDLEDGHTYEFNVLEDVLLVTDITVTV